MKNIFLNSKIFCPLFFLSVWFACAGFSFANGLTINEVAWMGTHVSSNDEWIELYNESESTADLSGFSLRADDGTPNIFLSGSVSPYGYYLLERTDDDTVPEVPANMIFSGTLENSEESLGLYDALGNVVDYIASWLAGDNETKETMQRGEDGTWCTALGTPGAENTCGSLNQDPSDTIQGETDIALRISEVQSNGVGVDYVEVTCGECGEGVLVSDISVNGKLVETSDLLIDDQYVVFLFGDAEISSGAFTEYHVGGTGISGTQGEVTLGYKGVLTEAVCWNPGGIVAPDDEDQENLRVAGLWSGACLNSSLLGANITLARNAQDGWSYDHPTPGVQNSFLNQPPTAVITVQGSGLTEGVSALTFNPTGEDSSDPDLDPLTFLWDFGDGETFDKENPLSRTYGVGSYTVTLTVTDPFGASSTASKNIVVRSPSSGSGTIVLVEKAEETYDFSDRIFINEVLPNPEGVDTDAEFIELINLDMRTVDLKGWKLDDEEGGSSPFPLEVRLLPNEIRSFPSSLTKLSLKNTSEAVRLIAADSRVVSQILYEGVKEGESYSRNDENIFEWASPTPGMENIFFNIQKYSSGTVVRVIDGDTFEADFSGTVEKIRFIGIDAPEVESADKDADYFGPESQKFLSELLSGTSVRLDFDTTKRDTYERLLAYAYLGDSMVNLRLLEEGYVKLYDRYPFREIERFRVAEKAAQESGKGLWGEAPESPPEVGETAAARVIFDELLINPEGKDDGNEYIILMNISSQTANLSGMCILNNGKKISLPSFSLAPDESKKITSLDVPFTLRNSSGELVLMRGTEEIDSFSYTSAVSEGAVWYRDHMSLLWKLDSGFGVSEDVAETESEDAVSDKTPFLYDFPELISGMTIAVRTLDRVRVADVSRLSQGVFGVSDGTYCYDIFFDSDKQTSFFVTLLFKQGVVFSLRQDCFGEMCVLSGMKL